MSKQPIEIKDSKHLKKRLRQKELDKWNRALTVALSCYGNRSIYFAYVDLTVQNINHLKYLRIILGDMINEDEDCKMVFGLTVNDTWIKLATKVDDHEIMNKVSMHQVVKLPSLWEAPSCIEPVGSLMEVSKDGVRWLLLAQGAFTASIPWGFLEIYMEGEVR